MKVEVSERFRILFIIFVALGVYYPALFAEVNSLDDYRMLQGLLNVESIDLKGLFLPHSPVKYYRPLLYLTFVMDQFLWLCDESFMHLENILLHALNGVLVFYISKELVKQFELKIGDLAPMFISLLFILHPINTEAVNWISGRSDILAGSFVFLSFLVFLKKGMDNYIWCWIAAFFYLLGLLSKEVAIGLLPAIGLFLVLKEKPVENIGIKNKLKLFSPFFVITIIYFLMRMPPGHINSGISTAARITEDSNIFRSAGGAIKAFGFYIKKLFVPLPLNFGIIEINRVFYFWVGVIALGISSCLLFMKRTLVSFFLFFGVLFFLPAIPVAISKIAWTPLAERYLYISSFGASALTIVVINRVRWNKEITYGILSVLLLTLAIITVNRNIVWQKNITLYEDTIRKSPNFTDARNEYGIALAKAGRVSEAMEQFDIAGRLMGNKEFWILPSLNKVYLSGSRKDPDESKKDYLRLLDSSLAPAISREILSEVIKITEKQIFEEQNPERRKGFYREAIYYFERLYELSGNSFYLYKTGQFYLALEEKGKALEFFRKAVELAPNEYYSEPARKLIKKLGSPKSGSNN